MFKITLRTRVLTKRTLQSCYCSTTVKEDSKKSKMPPELTKKTDVTSKAELSKLVTKENLQWRTPWHQKEGQYYSTLRTFYSEENNVNIIKFLQTPIDLSPMAIKKWWARKKQTRTIALQQYLPERNQALGNELAAAHFIVHRAGSVKFYGDNKWIKANEYNEYNLPAHYETDKVLQAIDCTDMELYYEGLANLRDLRQVEWFSINNCEHLDDWALDRIANVFSESLLYLDLRNCPLITAKGIGALYKMKKLKILYVDDVTATEECELTCLLLQELNPSLDIREE